MSIKNNFPTSRPSLSLDFANTKTLDSRITFARATTAKYYDGKTVAKAEENLFVRSQEFDNVSWAGTGVTITANSTTAPDGTTTADTLTLASDSGDIGQTSVVLNTSNSFAVSLFVKYVDTQWLRLALYNTSSTISAYVDVQNGVAGTVTSGTLTVTSVGNSWYRIQFTATQTAGSNGRFFLHTNAVDGSVSRLAGSVFLWGAQLEQRSTVTAYTATTTQPITNYIPTLLTSDANTARFDHNPVTGESLGLLIEEQRSNLILQSETFNNASWTKGGCAISANTIIAPDGTLNGDKVVEDTTTGDHRIYQGLTFTSGTVYTFSVYAKAAGRSLFQLYNAISGGFNCTFNLVAGTVAATTGTATINSVGNGWYRCTVSNTAGTTASNNNQIRLVSTGTTTSYTGDGYSGIYIWGAQLEAGAFATSYIPTVASQVTRAADSASMTGTNFSSWYRADEGTLYVEANSNRAISNFLSLVDFGQNTTSRWTNAINTNGFFNSSAVVNSALNLLAQTTNVRTQNISFKTASVQKDNFMAACLNGGTVVTDTSGIPYLLATQMVIGTRADFNVALNGTIKKIAYYPLALNPTNLQALTGS